MIDACVVWPNGSGGIGVGSYAKGFDADEAAIDELVRRHVPPGTSHMVMTKTSFKTAVGDRTFREAWECDNDATPALVRVNMPKARGIHMNKIRVVRDAELGKKDVTFMRAVEAGDTSSQSTIATEKQTLRDIPQTFDLTTDNDTPVELQARWPSELPARE